MLRKIAPQFVKFPLNDVKLQRVRAILCFEDVNSDCLVTINLTLIKGINRRENVEQSTFLARMEGRSFEEELLIFEDKSYVVFGKNILGDPMPV